MVLHHPSDIQFFNGDVVKPTNEFKTCFVREVQALTLNFQVLLCKKARSFSSVVAAAFLPTDRALRRFQSSFGLAQVFRVSNLRAGRKCGEALNAHVNADAYARLWDVAALIQFYAEGDVLAINFSFECDRLDCAFYGAREATRQLPILESVSLSPMSFQPDCGKVKES